MVIEKTNLNRSRSGETSSLANRHDRESVRSYAELGLGDLEVFRRGVDRFYSRKSRASASVISKPLTKIDGLPEVNLQTPFNTIFTSAQIRFRSWRRTHPMTSDRSLCLNIERYASRVERATVCQ